MTLINHNHKLQIETLIVQIDQTDKKELGGQMRNPTKNSPLRNLGFQSSTFSSMALEKAGSDPVSLIGNLIGSVSSLVQGTTAVTLSKAGSVWGAFKALKDQTNVSLIAQPFVTVANRVEGVVSVGERRRIEKESSGSQQGFEDVDVATKIRFTPQINPDGIINLKVNVDLSEFLTDGANRTEKKLTTNVTVASGQVLVLGGFVKTKVTESSKKSPLLGDIPVLGWLAKHKSRSTTKSYIFLFVCPTIVKPRQSPGSNLYTKMKLHSATKDIEKSLETAIVKDPIHNWFFNPDQENYSHKVVDFSNARYQPTTVDIRYDPYYRSSNEDQEPNSIKEIEPTFDDELTSIPTQAKMKKHRFTPSTPALRHPNLTPRTTVEATQPPPSKRSFSLAEQREKLKQLVAGTREPTPTLYDPNSSRGKLKQLVATSSDEDAINTEQQRITQVKEDFRNTLIVSENKNPESISEVHSNKIPSESNHYRDYLKTLLNEDPSTELIEPEEQPTKTTQTEKARFKDDFFDYSDTYDPLPQLNKYRSESEPSTKPVDKRKYLQELVAANPITNPFASHDGKDIR